MDDMLSSWYLHYADSKEIIKGLNKSIERNFAIVVIGQRQIITLSIIMIWTLNLWLTREAAGSFGIGHTPPPYQRFHMGIFNTLQILWIATFACNSMHTQTHMHTPQILIIV